MNGKPYFLLKIEGIEGETADPKYPGYFEIDSWSWGVSMASTMQSGGGMAAGKANLSDFSFTKPSDKSTPKLMEACATGVKYPSAIAIARKQGQTSGELEEFAKYTFTDLVISRYSVSGSGEIPAEQLSVSFGKVDFEYDEKKLGESQGWQKAGFDSKTNAVT